MSPSQFYLDKLLPLAQLAQGAGDGVFAAGKPGVLPESVLVFTFIHLGFRFDSCVPPALGPSLLRSPFVAVNQRTFEPNQP